VSEPAAQAQEIVCPHCGKPFEGDLLSVGTRHEGFKCPHCQLVVPVDRVAAGGGASSPS
jgi:transposase